MKDLFIRLYTILFVIMMVIIPICMTWKYVSDAGVRNLEKQYELHLREFKRMEEYIKRQQGRALDAHVQRTSDELY